MSDKNVIDKEMSDMIDKKMSDMIDKCARKKIKDRSTIKL